MGVVQLVDFLEQSFGIKIRAGEVTIQNFQTVDAMFALIERKRAGT
jgi:acyl carrier protein